MDDQRHLIRTQAIQIAMARSDSAPALMNLAGNLWRTQLAADAAEIFSANCPPEEYFRLDRLELTLGTIAEEDFATEFPARFRARLAEELARQLRQLRDGDGRGGQVARADRTPLELLEYLLLHGALPWWAPQNSTIDPALMLVEALRLAPKDVAALVRRIGRHQRVRSRLVHWLADPEIAALIRAVAPADADFILRYAEDLEARQQEERIVPAGAAEFRQAKWEIILGHLLADRGSRFNAKSFLRQTLRELAGHFRLAYADLLGELARVAAEARVTWRESSLPGLLGEIFAEDVLGPGAPAGGAADERSERRATESVAAWLRLWGAALRERPWSHAAARRAELVFWRELSAAGTRAVVRQLVAHHGAEAVVEFLGTAFSEEERAEFLGALGTAMANEPAGPDWSLAKAVAEISSSRESEAQPAVPTAEEQEADFALPALRVLLETGALPSTPWARRWHSRTEAWLDLTLALHAEAVPPLLRAWARAGRLTGALAAHSSDRALESIIEVVEPAHSEEVIVVARATVRARPERAGLAANAATWRAIAWEVVFNYLLSDRGSVFNARSFLAHNVRGLAARHRVDVRAVWSSLAQVAAQDGQHQLLSDLRAIMPDREEFEADIEPPVSGAEAWKEAKAPPIAPGPRLFFTEESLRRSAVVRLRLLRLALAGAPILSEGWAQALLPLLWELLAAGEEAADEPWRDLARQMSADPAATELILRTGGERALAEMIFAGEPAQAAHWLEAVAWLEHSPAAAALFPGGRSGLRGRLWRALAELWREAGGRPIRDVAAWLARVLLRVGVRAGAGGTSGPAPEQAAMELWHALLVRDGGREATLLAARLPERKTPAAPTRRPPEAPAKTDPVEPPESPADAKETADAKAALIKISNAGLVLLCPFFPEFYKRCHLLDGPLFRDFQATQRAVHLLQFLVNGGVRTHEYTLVLNKILCGLDPEVAVVPRVELTEEEQAAGRQLLDYAAGHWARGAVISVEGLRASYLHRPGWLKRGAEGWSLRVERRGWDVLLPDLPWSFPGPRPAWMPQPLQVDWI